MHVTAWSASSSRSSYQMYRPAVLLKNIKWKWKGNPQLAQLRKAVKKRRGIGRALSGKRSRKEALRRKKSGKNSSLIRRGRITQDLADQVIVLVNLERTSRGIPALIPDAALGTVATAKSVDMRDNNYFSHESPTYGSPSQMLTTFGVRFSAWAENIAWGYLTPESVVAGWMNSPGHRANILNPTFTRTGVGWAAGGPRRMLWTQLFIN